MLNAHLFHSPSYLNSYPFLSIGKQLGYTNEVTTTQQFEEYFESNKTYLEALLNSSKTGGGRPLLIMSGTYIEHLQLKSSKIIEAIKTGLKKNEIVLLGTTYHASLSSLFSLKLFAKQIKMHQKLLLDVFEYEPTIFYNTGALYTDKLSAIYDKLGFTGAVVPSSNWHLNGRPADDTFYSKDKKIKLLLTGENGSIRVLNTPDQQQLDLNIEDKKKPSIEKLLSKEAKESYLVPHSIADKHTSSTDSFSLNTLQDSVKRKIMSLEEQINLRKKSKLTSQLSKFTSLDYFEKLDKSSDPDSMRPFDHYISMMNILSDFEINNKL